MKNNKIYEDLSIILQRGMKTFLAIEIIFILLVLFFWKIQILDHQKYWKKSEANRIREIILPSPRGRITDRSGVILANNIASFKASLIRENLRNSEGSYQKIARLLDFNEGALQERLDKYRSLPEFKPIVIKDNLSFSEVARIEGRKLEFPELVVQAEPKRYYPFGTFASHVLGYLQEVSLEEMKSGEFKEKRLGDLVGKTGIELEYENKLMGTDGQVLEIVDSLGRSQGELARRESLAGQNIELTLDYDIQKKAEELLAGREGAVVVLDPQSGEIMALASYPKYDPNKFINRFTPSEWMDIVNDPEFPMENRAIRGLYAPGSIFKLTIALAALNSHVVSESTSFSCNGEVVLYGYPFSCWFKPGHGVVNLDSGIKHSCNVYFYQLGRRLGIEEIARYARMLGFGKKTGVDLPGEKEGLVPDPAWKKKVRNTQWFPGETISVAIGQGPLLVTPLQVAAHTARLANRGKAVTPHLLLSEGQNSPWKEENDEVSKKNPVTIPPDLFDKVIRGMWKAVNEEGTARAARIQGFDVCGKTGSTQIVSKTRAEKLKLLGKKEIKTHSWFSGFAPRDNPEVVVTIFVEYGGMGGATSAPLARELFELFREKYDR